VEASNFDVQKHEGCADPWLSEGVHKRLLYWDEVEHELLHVNACLVAWRHCQRFEAGKKHLLDCAHRDGVAFSLSIHLTFSHPSCTLLMPVF